MKSWHLFCQKFNNLLIQLVALVQLLRIRSLNTFCCLHCRSSFGTHHWCHTNNDYYYYYLYLLPCLLPFDLFIYLYIYHCCTSSTHTRVLCSYLTLFFCLCTSFGLVGRAMHCICWLARVGLQRLVGNRKMVKSIFRYFGYFLRLCDYFKCWVLNLFLLSGPIFYIAIWLRLYCR